MQFQSGLKDSLTIASRVGSNVQLLITEKAPVVSTANLSPDSAFPQTGFMACLVQDEWSDERGRQLVRSRRLMRASAFS